MSLLANKLRKAVRSDDKLLSDYIDNVMAYVNRCKVVNEETGQAEFPNELLMRKIEKKQGIMETAVDDYRRQIAARVIVDFPGLVNELTEKAKGWIKE